MEVDLGMNIIERESVEYTLVKVIPHVSNLNSTTRKLQSSLYELFSQKYPMYPWDRKNGLSSLSKDNLYLTLKDKPRFWWVIKMTGEEGKDDAGNIVCDQSIEFLLAVPTDFFQAFKTKFYNHEQWKRATLEEVESDHLGLSFSKDTEVYGLRSSRNDMFSLDYDYKDQNVPIRDLMTVSRELDVGESVYFFTHIESVSRKKWKSLVDYSWEQWEKGGVPSRPGFNPKQLGVEAANLGVRGAYEVKSIIDDVLAGVRMTFFNDKEQTEKTRPKFINAERDELLVNGDLSKRTKNKRNMPVFKAGLCYFVTSTDRVRRDMLARSVSTSFVDLNGDNSLKPYKVTMPEKVYENVLAWKASGVDTGLLSIEEMGKLHQLPTADLQREFEDALVFNKRVEIEVDKELLDERGILTGLVTDRGTTSGVHIQRKSIDIGSTARVIMGSPRMGKDQMAINLVIESKVKHNMGAVVLDVINEQNGHRGMADALRDHLPPEDVVDLNLLDSENPIYLGLEPIVSLIKDPRIAADRVAEELCAFLLQDGDEDKLQTADHLREASKLANADILSIKHIFTSKGYRENLIAEKKDLFDVDIWDQYGKMSDARQQAIYTPIMRRIGQIVNSEFMKPIFCQRPNPTLDLFKLIDEGKVVIFRMKSGVMSTRVIETLCYWIVLVTFMIKLAQEGRTDKNKGTYLVLNEPHQYLTDALAYFIERIFAEGPKYKLIPLLIFHNFKQFKKYPGFIDIMKSASLNWHLFKNTNEDVYKELFGYLGNTFESPKQAFEATKRFQYIGIWLNSMGEYYDPFVADALPMVSDRYKVRDNSHLTATHSKKYGRPIREVLDEIRRRNKEALALNEEPEEEDKPAPKKRGKTTK